MPGSTLLPSPGTSVSIFIRERWRETPRGEPETTEAGEKGEDENEKERWRKGETRTERVNRVAGENRIQCTREKWIPRILFRIRRIASGQGVGRLFPRIRVADRVSSGIIAPSRYSTNDHLHLLHPLSPSRHSVHLALLFTHCFVFSVTARLRSLERPGTPLASCSREKPVCFLIAPTYGNS